MKYCEEYAALLDLYVDAELTADEMQRVEAHLTECPACRAYVDDALAIRAAFADLEDVEVPAGFAESVCAAIRAEAMPRKAKKTAHWGRVLVPLAACCAIVILLQNGPIAGKGNSDSMMKSVNTSTAFDSTASTESAPAEAEYKAEDAMLFSAQDADNFADQVTTVTADEAAVETEEEAVKDTEPAENGSSASRTEEQKETAVEQPQEPGAEQPESSENTVKNEAVLSTLILPAEAAEFLADFIPVEETDAQVRYHLFAAECEILQLRLKESEIDYVVGCSMKAPDEPILVILSK